MSMSRFDFYLSNGTMTVENGRFEILTFDKPIGSPAFDNAISHRTVLPWPSRETLRLVALEDGLRARPGAFEQELPISIRGNFTRTGRRTVCQNPEVHLPDVEGIWHGARAGVRLERISPNDDEAVDAVHFNILGTELSSASPLEIMIASGKNIDDFKRRLTDRDDVLEVELHLEGTRVSRPGKTDAFYVNADDIEVLPLRKDAPENRWNGQLSGSESATVSFLTDAAGRKQGRINMDGTSVFLRGAVARECAKICRAVDMTGSNSTLGFAFSGKWKTLVGRDAIRTMLEAENFSHPLRRVTTRVPEATRVSAVNEPQSKGRPRVQEGRAR